MDMNALLAMAKKKNEEDKNKFIPVSLTEENVHAIFDRCLVKEASKEIERAILFSTLLGYSEEEELVVEFDKDALFKNEKNIRYLYGQLSAIHTGENKLQRLSVNDLKTSYAGTIWCNSKSGILELLYVGCTVTLNLCDPFSKKNNDTTIISLSITPTLSPKDPNFLKWWEQHKAEWE